VQFFPHTETIGTASTIQTPISVTATPFTEEAFTPQLTSSPIGGIKTTAAVEEFATPGARPLTITVIYDNYQSDQRLVSAWGFSALVEYRDHILLFDTGGDGQIVMGNMRLLGIDPTHIDSIVLSHAHQDHTGGLLAVLGTGAKPVVYLLPSFSVSFKHQIEQFTKVNEVSPGQSLGEGVWTTGEMGGPIPEQALVIQTERGLVIITGCAHPGIVAIIEKAQDMFNEQVRLVLGGFHLGSKSEDEVEAILEDFRRLEVEMVAPCHCTGDSAIRMFSEEYGKDYIQVGVGSQIKLEK
jgi:7,8-dihydropterin-6-yl-methyl-4-(beta-D-ribofuranosyl)aminobenzene 5'-phosphate synthase